MRLEQLIGKKVRWNETEDAEIVEVFIEHDTVRAGTTIISQRPIVYCVFRLADDRLIVDELNHKSLVSP